MPEALPGFQEEEGLRPAIWKVQSQCHGTVVWAALEGLAGAQSCPEQEAGKKEALTSQVPPANGHEALE